MKRELMGRRELAKPDDHSMAHHLVTYSANNMVAPLTHAQIARDEYEDTCDARDDLVTERDAMQARLDEAVALLRGVTYSFVSLSEQSDSNALDLLSIVRKQRNSDLNNAELFLSTLENGGA